MGPFDAQLVVEDLKHLLKCLDTAMDPCILCLGGGISKGHTAVVYALGEVGHEVIERPNVLTVHGARLATQLRANG